MTPGTQTLGTYTFGVHAFGRNLQIAADCLETYSVLDRYVFPSMRRVDNAASGADVLIRLVRVGDQFELLVDDVMTASADTAMMLVPNLIRALDENVIHHLGTMHAVHAGVVLLGERALLLPGATHAGKSSLVAELLRRGATYFSDEYALIDSAGRVHPYPRPLLVRNGSPEQRPVLPTEYGASTGDASAAVGWILSLEYRPECIWNVAQVSQSEGFLILLRNTPHVLEESPEMVGAFQRAVAEASCCAGRRAEAADAVEQILRLIGGFA